MEIVKKQLQENFLFSSILKNINDSAAVSEKNYIFMVFTVNAYICTKRLERFLFVQKADDK